MILNPDMKLTLHTFTKTNLHTYTRLLIAVIGFLTVASAWAAPRQTPEQRKAAEIRTDDAWVYGEGFGPDYDAAYNAALHNMVSKIAVTVQGSSRQASTARVGADGTVSGDEQFESVVESYTTPSSLRNVQALTLATGNEYSVFVYMKRSEINAMHEHRRRQVADLARDAIRARDNGKVDIALQYLYRAYVLLQSLPSPSAVTAMVDDQDRVLATWIPEEMRDIVHDIHFGVASVKEEGDPANPGHLVELLVTYKGARATSAAFKYATPSGYSGVHTARDGMVQLELPPSMPIDQMKLYIEYMFRDENHTNAELQPLLETFNGGGLVPNSFALNTGGKALKADKKETKAMQTAVAAGAREGITPLDKAEAKPYAEAMSRLITAITMHDYKGVDDLFTDRGRVVFDKLIQYGKARVIGKATADTYSFYPFRDQVMCRSVPMSFTFDGGKRVFTEDVTVTFDSTGKIDALGFGLGSVARKDIFGKQGKAWTDYRKMALVNFLENYRTAFALKQLPYIESIFDDDAVIIVGHVTQPLQRSGRGDGFGMSNNQHVTYAEKNKQQYMDQLRRCFAAQEYINVQFADTDVERSGVGGETYSIQLRQDYVSKTYGDQGYLFLFVDFSDDDKPLIHVRTWQTERNPDLTPNLPPDHPRAGLFSPGVF